MILQRDMEITRRYPACENEKTYLQSYFLTLYFKAIFLSEIK